MTPIFPARVQVDESGMYFVQFLDLSEAITEGKTLEEALFNAQEVLTLTLESRLDEGINIPDPQDASDDQIHYIAPAARVIEAWRI